MKIKIVGFLDKVVEVDEQAYRLAEQMKTLSEFMDPILETLSVEVVFGPLEEFENDQV